ncbi:MAG: DNA phosphorothioation system sulfurtransferase DndC [Bacteroidetes bacterium]|nr:DNA phosphorothioation system sulfurtransferase DndC [Bacteroidota bacterium]MBT6688103.1 DNA phosphorothioation system sulfurtransferase DndC [Bacteroidota bacterium]MBT7142697.1 DNA phosphorothioation system sulfurtransferase DndC [Bacteroidota bacterium]MBT7490750.1 DNA phosphorothioation system sulfurtransferase DndC [Bacteroidota bacterium]
MNKRIDNIVNELVDQYTYGDTSERPWIIGFSGGKDSTVLLTLVWRALEKIKKEFPYPFQLRRQVYVVCNDTMVENPIITEYVDDVLSQIEKEARNQDLPIIVQKTIPKIESTFWVNILGKGYPVPNNAFRWCTDKLKIRPTSSFIEEQVSEKGEAIILIGVRSAESATRGRSIKKHEIKGKRLTKHPNHHNTLVYSPIKELMLEEIWYIINALPSPWNYDNTKLFQIYSNASADDYECPTVVTNKSHTSCGQSRFGCWTCTVVKEDKSMTALIKNGEDWMTPLLKYRDNLEKERNISDNRLATRRNGQPAVTEDGHKQGNYSPEYRAKKLRELLELQIEIQKIKPLTELITNQELIAIQVYWYRDGIFDFKVGEIFARIYGRDIETENANIENSIEKRLLKSVCENNKKDYELINNLLTLQHSKTLLLTNYGLQNDIEKRIESFVKEEANHEN